MNAPAKRTLKVVLGSIVVVAVLGLLDYLTGALPFEIFYLLPVAIGSWFAGRWLGIALAFLCTGVWLPLHLSDHVYLGAAMTCWETATALGIFVTIALIVSSLRRARLRLEATVKDLKRSTEELARSNHDLEQFAYVASHDLQEPLRTVSGFVELLRLKHKAGLDEEADKFINFAVDGTKRMQALIADLLAYARVGTKAKPFEPIDCQELLADVEERLAVAVQESQAAITHEALPTVLGDATQLGLLLQNLIGNAIKFRGREKPLVRVSARREGPFWEFSVADNGIGIEPQHFDRIFEIFQRLHDRSCYPGTGIGLAIAKKVVERHGGKIWVKSEPGKGTTFCFTLKGRE
jgi:light-regulated signal transduction histidine kinase (bacteriophytochrome)